MGTLFLGVLMSLLTKGSFVCRTPAKGATYSLLEATVFGEVVSDHVVEDDSMVAVESPFRNGGCP